MPRTTTLQQYVEAQPRKKRLAVIAAELGIQPSDLAQALNHGILSGPKRAKLLSLGIKVQKEVRA